MPAGRPSNYDYSLCEKICEQIARGGNIIKVLESDELYPSWETFRRWKREHAELQALYVKSVQDKSEAVLLEIDEIAQELRTGEIDASTANVLTQTLKWKAAKFYPKMFGDRTQIEQTSTVYTVELSEEERRKILEDLEGEL